MRVELVKLSEDLSIAEIDEARAHLAAALAQVLPEDEQGPLFQVLEHLRRAHVLLGGVVKSSEGGGGA